MAFENGQAMLQRSLATLPVPSEQTTHQAGAVDSVQTQKHALRLLGRSLSNESCAIIWRPTQELVITQVGKR